MCDDVVRAHLNDGFVVHQDLALNMLEGKYGAIVQCDEEFLPFKNQADTKLS